MGNQKNRLTSTTPPGVAEGGYRAAAGAPGRFQGTTRYRSPWPPGPTPPRVPTGLAPPLRRPRECPPRAPTGLAPPLRRPRECPPRVPTGHGPPTVAALGLCLDQGPPPPHSGSGCRAQTDYPTTGTGRGTDSGHTVRPPKSNRATLHLPPRGPSPPAHAASGSATFTPTRHRLAVPRRWGNRGEGRLTLSRS